MKIKKAFFTLCVLLISTALVGQTSFEVKEYDMTVNGTSTVHDWTSDVTEVHANGKLMIENGMLKNISGLTVEIPVTSIQSSKGNTMNNKTYKALESDDHPKITYRLKKINSIEKKSNSYVVDATGDLTIAGNTRTVDMKVDANMLDNGNIQFTGEKALKMTDFNIDPPTALLGTLKTGDDITIKFEVVMEADKS